jgi:hypothetical protein
MWEYQIDTLVQNNFRVIAYDRRGFVNLHNLGMAYDYDTLTDEAIIEQLKEALVGFAGEVVRYFRYVGKGVSMVLSLPLLQPQNRPN